MFKSWQAIKSVTISTSALALLIITGLSASAQTYGSAANGQNAFAGMSSQAIQCRRFNGSQRHSYRAVALKDPVSAPYLPPYYGQGARYIDGVYYPYLKGRQCYVMHYLAKDSNSDLIRNYRESLLKNGWQIDPMQSGLGGLTAIRKENGLCVDIHVKPTSVMEFKSSLEIKYLTNGSVQIPNH